MSKLTDEEKQEIRDCLLATSNRNPSFAQLRRMVEISKNLMTPEEAIQKILDKYKDTPSEGP